jgi:hypothetical protein
LVIWFGEAAAKMTKKKRTTVILIHILLLIFLVLGSLLFVMYPEYGVLGGILLSFFSITLIYRYADQCYHGIFRRRDLLGIVRTEKRVTR